MQEFDIVLKLLLQQSKRMLHQVAGVTIDSWLPTELPRVQNLRMDLLGLATDGTLVQLECQSTNDPAMALRMAEHSLGVYRLHNQFPQQVVLYVGHEPLRMSYRLTGPSCRFEYRLIDLQELDGEPLLASEETSDNVLGVLTQNGSERRSLKYIVTRIADEKEPGKRAFYLQALLLLAGLRGVEEQVEEEARRVPILNSILDNKVLGREYRRGLEEGRQTGERILRRLVEQRFGPLPEWALQRLAGLGEEELADLGVRLFEARTIEELFRSQS